jgi:hypothetical protein
MLNKLPPKKMSANTFPCLTEIGDGYLVNADMYLNGALPSMGATLRRYATISL